ncbi:TPA: hypothetical protein HA241_04895 [Candidatus Woesearchaeota archaeon]|nr:hypothetical protein [Candidatus Woesearchaeota archaeon]
MDTKVVGWIQIGGGVLALLFPGGGVGMMGMMGFGGGTMMGGGWAVTLLALIFIVTGVFNLTGNKK